MPNNMRFYDLARKVPEEAMKPIAAGRLKGMTDVNPMYRIKRLTEIFGPCGTGWWYEITKKEIIDDPTTNQRAAFVDILLSYRDPETGEVSMGIPGTGGASFLSQERNGPYLSDECFKMALTDAISVAAKALGIAADVYWQKDRTKYSTASDPSEPDVSRTKGSTEAAQAAGQSKLDEINRKLGKPEEVPTCERCGAPITGIVMPDGSTMTATDLVAKSKAAYNGTYCFACMKALKSKKAAG